MWSKQKKFALSLITSNIVTHNKGSKLLESLISSKTRINLLLKFFLNPNTQAYLRELAKEFDESSNGVRIELNRLTQAKVLRSTTQGRTIQYSANLNHPLFEELSSLVRKMVGLDQVIEKVLSELGGLERALVTGEYASGRDSGLIDLVLVGKIDSVRLGQLTQKTEDLINRKIRTLILSKKEYESLEPVFTKGPVLLLWDIAPSSKTHSG